MDDNNSLVQWFLEPLNSFTNEVISRELLKNGALEENTIIKDSKGNEHSAYGVKYTYVTKLKNSMGNLSNIKFRVFYKRGKNGQINEWQFVARKKAPKKK